MSCTKGFASEFSGALGKLQVAVLEACQRERVWPAKVAAAVAATVEFAVEQPELARLLTIESLVRRPDGGPRYVRMLEHFAELLLVPYLGRVEARGWAQKTAR